MIILQKKELDVGIGLGKTVQLVSMGQGSLDSDLILKILHFGKNFTSGNPTLDSEFRTS